MTTTPELQAPTVTSDSSSSATLSLSAPDAPPPPPPPKLSSDASGPPIVVSFARPTDPRNPRDWRLPYRWYLSLQGSLQMFCVTFATSSYTGSYTGLTRDFGTKNLVNISGLTSYVLGLAVGALIWAPLSELYGRRVVLLPTLAAFCAFGAGVTFSQNIASVIVCRLFMGAAGASILSNSPGMLNDIWAPSEIALPMVINSVSPFLGPVAGPLVSGFISEYAGHNGWRWVNGICPLFGLVMLAVASFVPETYPVTILRRVAARATAETGMQHVSQYDHGKPRRSLVRTSAEFASRPFVFLFLEPIVFLLSAYTALIFGILYIFFGSFPFMYKVQRGWNEGLAGLPFLGLAVGLFAGIPISRYCSKIYIRKMQASPTGRAAPEERLWFAMIGSILLPISLFWMGWTSDPSIHWIAPVLSGIPFGIGILGMMSSIMAYLAETYTIYSASVFAANSLFRYILGATFPLFTTAMFRKLGTPWALSLLGFLALAGAPLPFVFYKFGPRIRALSKHAPAQPPPLPAATGDGLSEPIVFLNAGEEAVRQEELQDGLRPDSQGRKRDLEKGGV